MLSSPPAGRAETLTSRCRYLGTERLYLGRAKLTESELRVSGWARSRHVSMHLDLSDVESIERLSSAREPMLDVHLADGRSLVLGVSAPGLWRWAIRQRLHAVPRPSSIAEEPTRGDSGPAAPPALPAFRTRVAYACSTDGPVYAADRVHRAVGLPRWRRLDELVAG